MNESQGQLTLFEASVIPHEYTEFFKPKTSNQKQNKQPESIKTLSLCTHMSIAIINSTFSTHHACMYGGTSLLRTPLGQFKVPILIKGHVPHSRGSLYTSLSSWDHAWCPD